MKFKTTARDHFIVISRASIKKKKDKNLAILLVRLWVATTETLIGSSGANATLLETRSAVF